MTEENENGASGLFNLLLEAREGDAKIFHLRRMVDD